MLIFPPEVDSITIEMHSGWQFNGNLSSCGSGFELRITALTPDSNIFFYDEMQASGLLFSYTDTTFISETILLPDNTLELNSWVYHWTNGGDFWSSYLYWTMGDMVIIGHDGTSLLRSTWGSIKDSFI